MPSVAIKSSKDPLCAGDTVTFTAVASNAGLSPSYQWLINGIAVNKNSNVFTVTTLKNSDIVSVAVTNPIACLIPAIANSNQIIAIVNPAITPSIKISPDYYASCVGLPLTYTATITNGGNYPGYQWLVNGIAAGTNSPVFSSTTLQTGDKIACTLTSSVSCSIGAVTSNTASLSADPLFTNILTIHSSAQNDMIQMWQSVTFYAVAKDTTQASYQWQINGINAGTDSPTFSSSTLNNNDVISCSVTISGKCLAYPYVTSNAITVTYIKTVIIPNTFTPNGDGINDTWDIPSLSAYPGNNVKIFNRYGTIVFQSNGYSQAWDGKINGALVPIGTYYYIIDLKNKTNKIAGYLVILR